jgi:hypothetical protein
VGLAALLPALAYLPLDVPLTPDDKQARDLLAEELAKSEYQAAKPTWFDQLVQGFFDWMNGLTVGNATGPPAFGLLLVLVVVAALVVIAFLVFGLPRLNRRSRVSGSLFGEDDARTAAQLRTAAATAAAAGDYSLAIAELFRAIARGLAERTLLTTTPGTTAHGFAVRAGRMFESQSLALAEAATAFDAVRYLGEAGTRAQFEQLERLDEALRAARPALAAVSE